MQESIKVIKVDLLCEYMKNPVGLTMEKPRFFWRLSDNNAQVCAYCIEVWEWGAKQSLLSENQRQDILAEQKVWDSKRVEASNAFSAVYGGGKLKSGVTYSYRVSLYLLGEEDREPISEWGTFTMGLMEEDSWQAPWIGGIKIDKNSYLYRKQWVNEKEVRHAAAFVASPCYYVLTVNGKKADETVLNNAFADYEKSLYYRTYDITSLLEKENAVGIMTGLGWHSLREAEDGIGWGDSLFSLQIRLEYEDGSVQWILSDGEGWTYTTEGPIRYNSIYNGEIYDANKELSGWDCYGYDDSTFSKVVEREAPRGFLRSQMLEPIKVVRILDPVEIIDVGDGSYTLDFGVNFAGWVRLTMKGEKGQEVRIKPAELRHADGSVNPVSLRNAHPVDVYCFKGEGVEEYEPGFTYHGFRYAQIYGLKEKPTPGMFRGCVVRTAVERIGSFKCDHEIVNKFYNMVCQTEESNLHGVPTDCPQRDERLGWLNDMTVRYEGAMYNYGLYQIYAKWLRDIRDTQGKTTGAVTDTAPFLRYGFRPADPVSSSFLLLPWNIYLQYGDSSVIEENYEANAKWVEYLKRNSTDYIVNFSSMGDWAAPIGGTDHTSTGGGALSVITPQLLMSTGFFYYDCTLMEKMAAVLGKEEDKVYYHELAEQVRTSFNKTYFKKDKKYYAANSQASNVLPLYFGMVDKEDVEAVLANLCYDIEVANKGHLTTGNICTRYAIEVLFRYGKEDLAWHLLSQTEYPSWGYMIENGATTVWERWENVEHNELLQAMASMNHPMNGGAVVSLHKYLLGISVDEEKPGYEHIIIAPKVPKEATYAEASVDTIRGKVAVKWTKEKEKLILEVSLPGSSKASIYVPGQEKPVEVQGGDHSFTL